MGSGPFQKQDRHVVQTHELGEHGDPDGRRARGFHQERPVKPDSVFSPPSAQTVMLTWNSKKFFSGLSG